MYHGRGWNKFNDIYKYCVRVVPPAWKYRRDDTVVYSGESRAKHISTYRRIHAPSRKVVI